MFNCIIKYHFINNLSINSCQVMITNKQKTLNFSKSKLNFSKSRIIEYQDERNRMMKFSN